MKKNFKRWLALLLAVIMVASTGLSHADGFLKATEGEVTEVTEGTEELVIADETVEGEKEEPVEDVQTLEVPKNPEEVTEESQEPEASQPTETPETPAEPETPQTAETPEEPEASQPMETPEAPAEPEASQPAEMPEAQETPVEEEKPEEVKKPAQTLNAKASDGATVVVDAQEGALPEGSKVDVIPVVSKEVEDAVEKAVEAEGKVLVSMKAYDITISDAEGNVIQPDERVKVTIRNAEVTGEDTSIYHVDQDTAAKIADVPNAKIATFAVDHFSIYVVAGSETVKPEEEQLFVKINYVYEDGAIAEPSYTMLVEKNPEGKYVVSHKIPEKPGYEVKVDNPSFTITEDGLLTGTFDTNDSQNVDIVYVAKDASYKVKHLLETLDGEYVADEGAEETLSGKAEALTEAAAKDFDGFTAQEIEQKAIKSDGSTVVEIKYDRNDYTLTYVTMGGSYVPSVTVPYETEVELVSVESESAPTRTGYTFEGWYFDQECNQPADSSLMLKKDTNLYAKWDGAVVGYKVVYLTENADDDNYSYAGTVDLKAKAGTEVTADDRTEKPAEFDTEHFTFKSATTETVNADGSTVVNVKYSRNTYTIRFKGTAEYSCGKEEHTHTSECYILWNLICGKKEHTHSDKCGKISDDLTITAKYQANIKDLWNAAVGPGTKYEGDSWIWDGSQSTGFQATMPGNNKEVSSSNNNGGTKRVLTYYVEDPDGKIIYAEKTFSEYTTVVLNLTSGAYPTFDEEFFEIDGYDRYRSTIKEWSNGQKNGKDRGSWNTKDGNKFYYTRSEYVLKLVNGNSSETYKVPYQSNISEYLVEPKENPLVDGSFDGWYLDPSFQQKYNGNNLMPKSLVLYAKWNPVTYEVKFVDSENANTTYYTQTVESKGMATVPTPPKKPGYIFKGWFSDKECQTPFDFALQISDNTTVYAKWTASEFTNYTIKYVTDTGEPVAKEETYRGKVGATVLAKAIKATGDYEGYAVDKASQTLVLKADESQNIITFTYKKAGALKYKVQYKYGETVIHTTDEITSEVNSLKVTANPSLVPGYKLKQNFQYVNLTSGENIVIFQCEPETYKIEYLGVEGARWPEGKTPTEYVFNQSDITLEAPEKDGTVFIGWDFTSENGEIKLNAHDPLHTVIEKGSYGDLQFTARWAKLTVTGYEGVYDGDTHSVTASVEDAEGFVISYSTNDGDKWNNLAPVIKDVGEISVKVKAEKPGYQTLYADTNLKVTARPVTVIGEGWTEDQPYTGEAYTTNNYTFEDVVPGQTATISYSLSGTEVGTYTGEFEEDFRVMSGENDVTANYNLTTKTPGTLTIVASEIAGHVTLTPANVEKTYDGITYTAGVATAIDENGKTVKVEYSVNGTTWTEDPTTITATNVAESVEVKVRASVPGTYEGYVTGTQKLTINSREVSVTGNGWPTDQPYTGKAYTTEKYTFENVASGQTATISYSLSGTEVGTYTGEFGDDFRVMSGENNVTDNYELITKTPGTLTIVASEIAGHVTLTPVNVEKTYDGTTYTAGIATAIDKNGKAVKVEYSVNGTTWTEDPTEITATNVADSKTIQVRASVPGTYEGYVTGTQKLTISKRDVTVTGNGWPTDQPYTGKVYTTDEYTFENVVEGQRATISYSLSGTEVGTYTGEFGEDFRVMSGENDVTANYNLTTKTPGTLTIVASEIAGHVTLTPANVEKTYDGTTYTAGTATAIDENGKTVKVEYSVNGTTWTEDPTTIKATNVADSVEVQVRASVPGTYEGYVTGTEKLTINSREVSVTGNGWPTDQPYTGKAYTTDEYTFENVVPGQTATISYSLSGTEVGSYTGTFGEDFKVVINDSGVLGLGKTDVTANYKLTTKTPGRLNIVASEIAKYVTLEPVNVEKTYDGTTYTAGVATAIDKNGKNVKVEYSVNGTDWTEDPTTIKATNVSDSVEIKVRASVAGTYEGYLNGTQKLTINKREVILTSASDEKVYDGKELTNHEITPSLDGFVKGEEPTYTVTGKQILVGESKNTFEYTFKKEINANNYNITIVEGNLKVTDGTEENPVKPEDVVTKNHDNTQTYKLGDIITFTIKVTNIYAESKTITLVEQDGVTFEGNNVFENVAPGATIEAKAKYTVTEKDLVAGSYTNTVKALFEGENEFTNDDKVEEFDDQRAHLKIDKVTTSTPKNGNTYALGEEITYKITVTNDGNQTLKNIVVKDELTKAEWEIKELKPTAIEEFTTSYTVTEEDIKAGNVVNVATAEGENVNPGGKEPEVTPGQVEESTDKENPQMSVVKTVTSSPREDGEYHINDKITYKITVTNTGNVTLNDVIVQDKLNASGQVTWETGITVNEKNEAVIGSMKPGETVTLNCSYVVTAADAGKDLVNAAIGDSTETDPTPPSTTDPTEVESYYNLTINYVYADGSEAAPSVHAQYLKGESFGYASPVIDGFTPNFAFVRTGAEGMPARDVTIDVIYTANPVPVVPTPNPGTPEGEDTPTPGTDTPDTPTTGAPGGVGQTGTPTAQTPAAQGTPEEPVGAEIGVNGDGEIEIVPVIDEEVPLANRELDEHECCMLHFLLMLAAMIVYAFYTRSMKKRQARIAELADQLETELLKRKQETAE